MKRIVRGCLTGAALISASLLAVFAVVMTRTLTTRSVQVEVEPIPKLEVGSGAIKRLAGSIRIPTVSSAGGSHSDFAALESLHHHLEMCFPKVHATLNREVVNRHSLLFTDKVAVMAILEAVEILLNQGFRSTRPILIAFGHDEEIGGQAGAAQIAALLKTRGTRVEYALDEGSAVTAGIVPGLAPRAALIGIAEKGYTSVELSAVSPGGHSSMPPPQTAVGIVAAAVAALEDKPMPAALDGPAALLFDRLSPEISFWSRLPLANRWLFAGLIVGRLEKSPTTNAILRTTTAATIFKGGVKDNVLPAHARAVVNFRIKPGDTVQDVLAHVKKAVNDHRVEVRLVEPGSGKNPSRQSRIDSAGFKTIERSIRQVMPDAIVAPSLVVAATDSRHYEDLADDVYRFLPLVLGPDDTRRIHGTDERIAVEGYKDCVRFYVQLLVNEAKPNF